MSGADISTSGAFELPTGASRVIVHVESGSRDAKVAGMLLSVGGGVLVLGALAAPVYWALGNSDNPNPSDDHDRRVFLTASAIAGVVGLAGLFAGLTLVTSNGTDVSVRPAQEPSLRLSREIHLTPRGLTF